MFFKFFLTKKYCESFGKVCKKCLKLWTSFWRVSWNTSHFMERACIFYVKPAQFHKLMKQKKIFWQKKIGLPFLALDAKNFLIHKMCKAIHIQFFSWKFWNVVQTSKRIVETKQNFTFFLQGNITCICIFSRENVLAIKISQKEPDLIMAKCRGIYFVKWKQPNPKLWLPWDL